MVCDDMKNKKNIILFLTFTFIIMCSIFLFSYGNDFYWHLKTGEYIINNNKIPHTGIFSYYAISNNLTWISHEWLFEVIIYLYQNLFSNYGTIIYIIFSLIILSFLLWKLNQENFIKYPFYTVIWAVVSMLILANKILPRPHLISYILFAVTILIAFQIQKGKSNKLIFLVPIISILWSNIHGGSSNLSYIIYGIFLLDSIRRKDKELSKKYLTTLVLSLLFIVINPHGIKMIFYPYQNMTYKVMLSCIDEWQGLNIFSIDGIFYLLFIISIIYILFKNRKELSLLTILLISIFTLLAIKSTRFMPYLLIVSTSIIPNYFQISKFKIDIIPIFIFVVLVFIILTITIVIPQANNSFKRISDDMIKYLKEKENLVLYNSYNLGGYLIYKDIPVFIDSRADIYINCNFSDVCQIEKGYQPNLLEKYNFNTLIIENKSGAYSYLKNNDNYELYMQDKNNSLFIRK